MPGYYDKWSHAKADFEKTKALFPPELLARLNKGAGLGPALKTFDKADGHEERRKALMPVRSAKETYDKELRALMGIVKKKEAPAYKALERLEKKLLELFVDADKDSQPPRPGGSLVAHEVIRGFNLAGKTKPKYLDIQATRVDVTIQVDSVLDAMIKAGEESLKINYLGDIAKGELEKVGDAFASTMASVDAKIAELDQAGRTAKTKEANEVLKHYARLVEDRMNAAVEKEWAAYLARKKYLSNFRVKCAVKVTLGTIGVGVAVASAAMSFGVLWMNVGAAVKGISDIAQTIKTWSQDLETVYKELIKDIDKVNTLNVQRQKAIEKGEGQKASKTKEAAKEVVTGILPITKNMITSASSVEDKTKQYLGLVSKLESQADKLTGQLNTAVQLMTKLPEKQMTPALKAEAEKMKKAFDQLFGEIQQLHNKSVNASKFGERAMKEVQKLRREDKWSATLTADITGVGTKGAAIYALANFAVQCAKHGTSLLALL